MHDFKKLLVWQKGISFVKDVYLVTSTFPIDERFGLTSQLKRAAFSIPLNIAEGAGRASDKGFVNFLQIAYSSAYEVETILILCNELNLMNVSDYKHLSFKVTEIQKMLFSFIKKKKSIIE